MVLDLMNIISILEIVATFFRFQYNGDFNSFIA